MTTAKFRCSQCKKLRSERQRVFVANDWCQKCVDAETERSVREDVIDPATPWIRTKPPAYMK